MWKLMSVVAACWLAAVAGAQPGGFGIHVPAGGGPMPNYFSGTNCRASGSAQIGEPILHAELRLNGELVAEYHYGWEPEEPFVMSTTLAVMFDSSHWPSVSELEVRFWVYGLYTQQWYSASRSRMLWNQAMVYEHPDTGISPDPSLLVLDQMSGKNYWLSVQNGGQWTPEQYFANMNGVNVAFCATHGAPSIHNAGDDTGIGGNDYHSTRIDQIGQGLPPFNTGAPSINFFHLMACNCGVDDTFMKSLFPYEMGWGGLLLENQAMFAYKVYILLNEYASLAEVVWPRMVSGWTAKKTQEWFNYMLDQGILSYWAMDIGGAPRQMVPGDLVLFHGPDMGACRIKSVYTGTNTPPMGWYRQI